MDNPKKEEDDMQFGPQVAPSGRIVPLSERQQMALLKRIEEQRKQSTSPKPNDIQILQKDNDPERRLYNKLNKRNDRGETPLHRATIRGDKDKVVELLQQGADVNCKDFAGWTALHEACNHGFLDIVKTLIDHGADVNVRGLDGDTPLHDAAVNGHEEITIVLIQSGGNPESENDKKETPIEVAEEEETRRLLLEGIPIFKEFEKRRKKEDEKRRNRIAEEREKHKALLDEVFDAEDTGGSETDKPEEKNPQASRFSSDFDSEDDLPISHLKTDSSSSRASKTSSNIHPGHPSTSSQNETTLILPVDTEKDEMIQKSKIENAIPEDRKRKKELSKTDSEETSDLKDKPKKKKKKNCEKEDKKEKVKIRENEKDSKSERSSKEEKDYKKWGAEIERKIRQEAQEKGIDLTPEQIEKVRDRRLKKLRKKMADKQKENKQAPDQSDAHKEKSEKSSSITSPKPVTLPVAKTPIQSPSHDSILMSPKQTHSIETKSLISPKKESPKVSSSTSSNVTSSSPSEKKSSSSDTKIKEKVSPVILPKLEGILTPKREKKESSDSLLSPDDHEKKAKKKIKSSSSDHPPPGKSESGSSQEKIKKKEKVNLKIMEHSFLDAGNGDIFSQKKKQKQDAKAHAEKQRRIREKELKILNQKKLNQEIESVKHNRERSNSGQFDGPLVGPGPTEESLKRARRESLSSVSSSGAPKEKKLKEDGNRRLSSISSEENTSKITPGVPNRTGSESEKVKNELEKKSSLQTSSIPEETPNVPIVMEVSPKSGAKSGVFVPNVPPPTVKADVKTELKVKKEADAEIDIKEAIKTSPSPSRKSTLSFAGPPSEEKYEDPKPKKGPKRPFKPKRAWLTEAAQVKLEERLELEQTRDLKIEPHTKAKLAEPLQEICKMKDLLPRKPLRDENLNDYDERYHIKMRMKKQWSDLNPLLPSAPKNYWNFSIFTGDYHLSTSLQDRLSFPVKAPPIGLHPKLQSLFVSQEANRWKMLQRHTVAREKLKIAYEQEILRTHANAKRLEENQPRPYSACMVLQAEFENQYELPSSQSRSTPDNKRDRFTPRVLAAMLDEVNGKFGARSESMLTLQQMERDSCYQMQCTEWHLRAHYLDSESKTIKDVNSIPLDMVPKINIPEFKLFNE